MYFNIFYLIDNIIIYTCTVFWLHLVKQAILDFVENNKCIDFTILCVAV